MRKILKLLAVLALALIIVFLLIGTVFTLIPQTKIVTTYKLFKLKFPQNGSNIIATPHILAKANVEAAGKTYTSNGISLITNWKEKQFPDDKNEQFNKYLIFEGDKYIIINEKEITLNLYSLLLQEAEGSGNLENLQSAFRDLNINNDHDLFELMTRITDKDLTISTPLKKAQLYFLLLVMKNTIMGNTDKILTFKTNGYTFYQYKPLKDKNTVDIIFFDEKNNQHW